jgi:hypothetical protein
VTVPNGAQPVPGIPDEASPELVAALHHEIEHGRLLVWALVYGGPGPDVDNPVIEGAGQNMPSGIGGAEQVSPYIAGALLKLLGKRAMRV